MSQIYTIALIALLSAMSPGPDFLVVTQNALARSRIHGVLASIGVALGLCIHSLYCVTGVAAIISHSLLLFEAIKIIGCAYLAYLGAKNLFSTPKNVMVSSVAGGKAAQSLPLYQAFKEGFAANILNPKCTLFMLALFTLVIAPETPTWLKATFGLEVIIIGLAWFIFLSCIITHHRVQVKLNHYQGLISKLSGLLLIALSAKILLS